MEVSVAICTRNRCASLTRTLESLCTAEAPDVESWEVLVVDNASDDETSSVANSYVQRLPLRYILEPRPGLAVARNRAVSAFEGEYIVWIDDDVTVGRRWLHSYLDAFRTWPNVAVFGGPIVPVLEGDPPPWLKEGLDVASGAFASRTGIDEGPIDPADKIPLGANFAVRRQEQLKHRFDPELGRSPNRPHGLGEESAVLLEIFDAGASGRWVPGARIGHHVPEERQRRRYLWRYFFSAGQEAEARFQSGPRGPRLFGRPRWAWRSAVEAPVKSLLARLRGRHREELRHLRDGARAWGIIRGSPSIPDESYQ